MGHGFEAYDNLMLGSNKPAWHGMGNVIDGQPEKEEAMQASGLTWTVGTEPVTAPNGRGGYFNVPGKVFTVRNDLPLDSTARILGIVSTRYAIFQNEVLFDLSDSLVGAGGAHYESAGSLRNGKIVWVLAVLPGDLTVLDDKLVKFLFIRNSHDGTSKCEAFFTPIRVVCANTMMMALRMASVKVAFRHSGDPIKQIEEAKRVLGLADQYFGEHAATMEELARQKVDNRFVNAYLQALIPDPEDSNRKGRAQNTRNRIAQLFHGEQAGAGQDAVNGTAYGLLNATTQYTDHERTVRRTGERSLGEVRMESVLLGSGADFRKRAFDLIQRGPELVKMAASVN